MKLPQHPLLPVLSVVFFAYLFGDLACALFERRFSGRPRVSQATAETVGAAGVGSAPELLDLLNRHSGAAPPETEPSGSPVPEPGPSASLFPNLLGTMEGGGSALAILQMPGSSETAVVALGEEFQGLKLLKVSTRQAVMRDQQGRERTLVMGEVSAPPAATAPPSVQPVPEPYKTTRQLRQDIDNKARWIGHILVRPWLRNGENMGVVITYQGTDNPFARLGIQSGDVLLSLNGRPLRAMENIPETLMELRNSQRLIFKLQRNDQPLTLTVNLEP